jgi:hypothetical protein
MSHESLLTWASDDNPAEKHWQAKWFWQPYCPKCGKRLPMTIGTVRCKGVNRDGTKCEALCDILAFSGVQTVD